MICLIGTFFSQTIKPRLSAVEAGRFGMTYKNYRDMTRLDQRNCNYSFVYVHRVFIVYVVNSFV